MSAIILPPLPFVFDASARRQANLEELLRARDIEVARLVLEGAIGVCSHLAQADAVLHLLRKLELKHHE